MTTIVMINPTIPVGPRISSRSFPRESQRTAAARSALSSSESVVATSTVFDSGGQQTLGKSQYDRRL